ncbi:type II secretion system F family protein [Halorubellus sp. JP-L1]|uniref:type II secretion system F family protein n=1 Tax=Halorubellus sp. JP-L1 TaxID=2715753 RepID=UPI0034E94ECD
MTRPLSALDRAAYALFSRRADARRHERDRDRYRGAGVEIAFDVFVARLHALAWLLAALAAPTAAVLVPVALVPAPDAVSAVPAVVVRGGVGVLAAALAHRSTTTLGGRYLAWRARARRIGIQRTLPGAVRYLRALSTGTDDRRTMLAKVAENDDAYGATAEAAGAVLAKAELTGSLNEGLRLVARDTPSQDTLAPFLMKFREHATQGPEELSRYLRMESRMLGHRQARERERASGFLELVAELFVVLLVLPALLVVVLSVMSVLTPSLNQPIGPPLGGVTPRAMIVYGAAVFVAAVGALAAAVVVSLRPVAVTPSYERPPGVVESFATALSNPASAAVVAVPFAASAAVVAWATGGSLLVAATLGYVAYAVPVGVVATRRARRDDAKDRELKDFVHAVSGHVSLGRPFPDAVARVADEVDLGPLDGDVADLAFAAGLTSTDGDLRTAALDRFVARVGTPLSEQTMRLVTGALDAGSDTETVFETLQTEVGRLHHEKQSMRDEMLVYAAVGWTTAILVVGIVVAVNLYVLDSFAQLSAVSTPGTGFVLDPDAVDVAREHRRFYVVTQATMLASGWFAGAASRGTYDALLHSGLLVAFAYVVFSLGGLL